jgi:predicted DNA repair protein MutK
MATPAFFAVLRDVLKLASAAADDLASQSAKMAAAADDIAVLTSKAAVKTAGVAGDDLAVGAGQVAGVSPNRELPALWRITKGSALNKLWLGALLLVVGYYLPVAITVALVLGALYLAYEGGEALLEMLHPAAENTEEEVPLSEDEKVKGAIRTDMVLSFEMLVISLAATGDAPLEYKIGVLFAVGVLMTLGVYGLIGLIIRLDDMGLALARTGSGFKKAFGIKLANAAPVVLKVLGPIGMVAMLAVAGGILTHTAHIEYPHWTLGFLGDIAVGTLTGLLLAGTHHLWVKFRK